MYKTIQAIALLLLAGLGFGSPALAGDAMELKTANQEIQGTRDVEAGNFAAGIAKLERALNHANHALGRAPVLVNLCVAHAASGELDQASEYCDAALDTGVDRALAYNNRAVVNYLRGDIGACIDDLERAAEIQAGSRFIRRNLERARGKEARLASQT